MMCSSAYPIRSRRSRSATWRGSSRAISKTCWRWPGCEGLFPIANNGAGDEFLIDLRDPDPEVLYHLHETGEKRGTGARLSAFVSAPRRPVPDE